MDILRTVIHFTFVRGGVSEISANPQTFLHLSTPPPLASEHTYCLKKKFKQVRQQDA